MQKYWWVNHKQTFASEVGGGYIWSPKTSKGGARNEFYLNLTRTNPGDVIFSYADGTIAAIGVSSGHYRKAIRPDEFGSAGKVWDSHGWAVPIEWNRIDYPIYPKRSISQLAPLLPKKYSPLNAQGNGNQGCYLASISKELADALFEIISVSNQAVLPWISMTSKQAEGDRAEHELNTEEIESTYKEQLIKARRGQGKFRMNVQLIEKGCRVTGLQNADLLIASHIKPWKDSSNAERLDGSNGLLLSPHIDRLFDQGHISFSDVGELLIAGSDIEEVLAIWKIDSKNGVGGFNNIQKKFLEYHRSKVFKQ